MTPQNPTIELLDRKYAFVNNAQDEVFLLELERFLNFLLTDERFNDYAQLIIQEWGQRHAEYQRKLAKEKDRLIELKKRFVERYPELDDSNIPKPNALSINFEYEQSFANFDEVAKDDWQPKGFSLSPEKYNDNSSVNKLLGILRAKIEEVRENHPNQIDKEVGGVLVELENQHRYNHRDFVNSALMSPGNSLLCLINTIQKINPEPKQYESLTQRLNEITKQILFDKDIEGNIYGRNSPYGRRPDEEETRRFQKRIEICKRDLQRVYEELRACIGTHLSHRQLVHRYKQRCMWYDRERIRALVTKEGELIANFLSANPRESSRIKNIRVNSCRLKADRSSLSSLADRC